MITYTIVDSHSEQYVKYINDFSIDSCILYWKFMTVNPSWVEMFLW